MTHIRPTFLSFGKHLWTTFTPNGMCRTTTKGYQRCRGKICLSRLTWTAKHPILLVQSRLALPRPSLAQSYQSKPSAQIQPTVLAMASNLTAMASNLIQPELLKEINRTNLSISPWACSDPLLVWKLLFGRLQGTLLYARMS